MKTRSRIITGLLVFVLTWLGFGLVSLWMGASLLSKEGAVASQIKKAETATCKGVIQTLDKGDFRAISANVSYSFRAVGADGQGKNFIGSQAVSKKTVLKPGSTVTIRYVVKNPTISVIEGNEELQHIRRWWQSYVICLAPLIMVLSLSYFLVTWLAPQMGWRGFRVARPK